ncbi:MBOAT family O-acyltransferase [Methyloterricola oryzae]|uniref:MBOAT family O-acyltransferase n=1 Tax=Methyloterricola oryzae TaxID=1495050 RepID=UPI0005EB8A75|nr:MBOAT family protein [Methyloterricola oryzae]
MLFNSFPFIFAFLPIVFLGFFGLARISRSLASVWLGLASVAFYAYWKPEFVVLLLASITCNFLMASHIAKESRQSRRQRLLVWAIAINLAALVYFKYMNFFVDSINTLADTDIRLETIALPLGISFFTFTQIAFLVDTYRGMSREFNPSHYLLFVTWFPHLIAGPVLHHKEMMPQFEQAQTYRLDWNNLGTGATLFIIGLAKKVLLADTLAGDANAVFNAAATGVDPGVIAAWVGALSYTFQLYFDFSGYSDMAVGLSLMFGVRLPLNFDSPYKAVNIVDFWRRWHMTLSRFLRDYVYIPLGGNRLGELRRNVNLLVTMLLGGLWHGANWTFVAWGGFHGALLVINHAWWRWQGTGEAKSPRNRLHQIWTLALTFILVVIGWVYFRSADFSTAHRMIAGMFGFNGLSLPKWLSAYAGFASNLGPQIHFSGLFSELPEAHFDSAWTFGMIGLSACIVWFMPNSQQLVGLQASSVMVLLPNPTRTVAVAMGVLFALSLTNLSRVSEFLYFQF